MVAADDAVGYRDGRTVLKAAVNSRNIGAAPKYP